MDEATGAPDGLLLSPLEPGVYGRAPDNGARLGGTRPIVPTAQPTPLKHQTARYAWEGNLSVASGSGNGLNQFAFPLLSSTVRQ
jgi:hypothetical protein